MTSTHDPLPLGDCDDAASVLRFAREQKSVEDQAGRELLRAAARWAAMHSTDSLVGPVEAWHEAALPLGGEGCPEVAEFAVAEFAAAIGRSTDSGRHYLARAVEGHYRLTRCWARLVAGDLVAWKLGMIADQTMCLSPAAAAFVDRHVASVAHKIGPAQLVRLIEEAKARFDPEATEAERQAAADRRRLVIDLAGAGVEGTVHLDGTLDLADALDLEQAISTVAAELAALGSTESWDVRRSQAAGEIARAQLAFGFDAPQGTPQPRKPRRQLVLHAHLAADAVNGAGGHGAIARLEERSGPITAEQVRTWCANPEATVIVKPVLDLHQHRWVGSYEAPDRLKNQTNLRDATCVFPWCSRPAFKCDTEHRVPHGPGAGSTCSCNLAPACRRHHRCKTTGGWTYLTVEPGVYLWRSPLGYQYLRDHTGTLDVTPDHQRREYSRTLIAHFWPTEPDT